MRPGSSNKPDIDTLLPDSAPDVRLTAGINTPAQKAWNLRRPITLIGSRRPAHIVIHDEKAAEAHCVVVNTGVHVLITNLASATGTMLNDERFRGTRVLQDEARIRIGDSELFAHITDVDASNDSADQINAALRLSEPLALHDDESDAVWRIDRSVSLIGRHEDADVRLEHENVALWHAVLFRYLDGMAIYNVGGENGVWVRGEHVTTGIVALGDRIIVGPFSLGLAPVSTESVTEPQFPPDRADHPSAGWPDPPHAQLHSPFAIWRTTSQTRKPPAGEDASETDWPQVVQDAAQGPPTPWTTMHVVPASPDGSVTSSQATHAAADDRQDGDTPTECNNELLQSLAEKLDQRERQLLQRETALRQREQLLLRRWTQLISTRCRNCGSVVVSPESMDVGEAVRSPNA